MWPERTRLMPGTILVVDDAAFMRMMIRDILEAEDYTVHEATNGAHAIEVYRETSPDMVTMDITMPELSGVEAVRSIREWDPEARIIMVSAMGQEAMIAEALEAGAMDFIVKPFQPAKVVELVEKCLNTKR